MISPLQHLEDAQWDELVRLNRKSSLMSLGLVAVVLALANGFPIARPGFMQIVAGLAVAYFGALRYVLTRALSVPSRRQKLLVGFFHLSTLAEALSWAALVSAVSHWDQERASPAMLAIVLMLGISMSSSASLYLRPKLLLTYLVAFFGGTLAYFQYVGGQSFHPYLTPLAVIFLLYLMSLSKTQQKIRMEILRSQTQVLVQNDVLQIIIDDAPAMVALLSDAGRFQYANKHFENVYGLQTQHIVGTSVHRLLEQDVSLNVIRDFVRSSKIHFEQKLVLGSGADAKTFWVVQRRSPDNTLVLCYWLDLSQYEFSKVAEAQQELQAIEAKKIQILGEFSEHIFRELNRPLALLWGNFRKIEKSPISDKIEASLQKLVALAKSLRSMANLQGNGQGGDKSFKLGDLIDRGTASVKVRYDELKIGLEVVNPEPSLMLVGSMMWVEQILENLLMNSADALKEVPDSRVKIVVSRSDSGAEIWVQDSGKALGSVMRERIFDSFFTTKAPGDGMGIGLSLSRELATRMGGSLEFKETPEGTNGFSLKLRSLVVDSLKDSKSSSSQDAA
jgi:nitrogen-specific signal transduction histidine kinase